MAGRRRGARSGRGWDAAPSRAGGATPAARRKRGGPPMLDQFGEFVWPEGAEPAEGADLSGDGGSSSSSARGGGSPRGGRGRAGSFGRRGESSPPPIEDPRDEAEIAREICLRQLAVRPRTRAELATALSRRGVSAETAAEVLDRYDEVGM